MPIKNHLPNYEKDIIKFYPPTTHTNRQTIEEAKDILKILLPGKIEGDVLNAELKGGNSCQ
jgi:hypothetical protein